MRRIARQALEQLALQVSKAVDKEYRGALLERYALIAARWKF